MSQCEKLLTHATTIDRHGHQHKNQAVAINKGRIVWCGSMDELPQSYLNSELDKEDCQHKLLTPGLIDCHTHLVYAGHRADEFAQRLQGATYEEIARSGGGILSTVKQLRAASEEMLLAQALPRITAMRQQGVLTVEIKSGYGLDLDNELKMLRVAKKLGEMLQIRVVTTFLGAHALPPEYQNNKQAYIDYLCRDVLPAVVDENLVDAVDAFCETIGFSLAQTEQVFQTAHDLGLPVKCHAEQLSNMGAASLAAQYSALSCDHLEHLDLKGAKNMANAGTVAVLLPGAFYFLRETRKPPIETLREAGVGMAVATDCNPGSSPTTSLLLMMNMACQFFSLTVPEALSAVTWQAARALGIDDQCGAIETGMKADLLRWSIQDAAQLCYYFGYPFKFEAMISGKWQSYSLA